MKIITINLSEPHVKALKMLQDLGLYPSRSEAIRVAIRDFLQKEFLPSGHLEKKERAPEEIKKEITILLRKLDEQSVA